MSYTGTIKIMNIMDKQKISTCVVKHKSGSFAEEVSFEDIDPYDTKTFNFQSVTGTLYDKWEIRVFTHDETRFTTVKKAEINCLWGKNDNGGEGVLRIREDKVNLKTPNGKSTTADFKILHG